jgi:hypothetical protein
VAFVEHDDEIEVFAANRVDDALGEGILPRASGLREDLLIACPSRACGMNPCRSCRDRGGDNGGGVVREGVDDLLGGSGRRGVIGDVEVEDVPAMAGELDEHAVASVCGSSTPGQKSEGRWYP